jgi:ribonuclease P protein component
MSPGKFPVSVRCSKGSAGEPSLILVVPKKAIKNAATRNLLRRRLRVIFKPFLTKANNYKVFVGSGADKLSFAELKESLLKNLKTNERNF